MLKARPVWEELPINFKRDMVDRLDFKSRCRLKICSTSDNEIVSSRPCNLETLTICPPNEIKLCGVRYKCSGIEELIQMIITIFEHPKSYVKTVEFNFDRRNEPENVEFFLDSFVHRLKFYSGQNPRFQLRSVAFRYEEYYRRFLEGRFLDVLQLFDSKVLRSITLTSNPSFVFLDSICSTEQWRNAREFRSSGDYDYEFPVEYYKHFNRLNAPCSKRLNGDQCWTIIESFIARNAPKDSAFLFPTQQPLPLQEIFSKFSVPAKNEPTGAEVPLYTYVHTQRFQLADPRYILMVKFGNQTMDGAVVRNDIKCEEADFRWSAFRSRIDW